MNVALLAFLFVGFHCVCDFAVQPDVMVAGKNRHGGMDPAREPRWYYWLSAHALAHGSAVALALIVAGYSQFWWLGIFEAASHAAIDDLKCARRISLPADQALHYLCKAAWVAIVAIV